MLPLSTAGEYDEKPSRDRDHDRDRRSDFSEGGDRERERRPQERDREREGGRRSTGPPTNAWSRGKPRSLGGSGPDRDTPRAILKRVEEPQAPVSDDVGADPAHHKNELSVYIRWPIGAFHCNTVATVGQKAVAVRWKRPNSS